MKFFHIDIFGMIKRNKIFDTVYRIDPALPPNSNSESDWVGESNGLNWSICDFFVFLQCFIFLKITMFKGHCMFQFKSSQLYFIFDIHSLCIYLLVTFTRRCINLVPYCDWLKLRLIVLYIHVFISFKKIIFYAIESKFLFYVIENAQTIKNRQEFIR